MLNVRTISLFRFYSNKSRKCNLGAISSNKWNQSANFLLCQRLVGMLLRAPKFCREVALNSICKSSLALKSLRSSFLIVCMLLVWRVWYRDGTGQNFLDPTGKFQNLRRLTSFWPARSTVFLRKVFVHCSMHLMKKIFKKGGGTWVKW